MVLGLVSGGSGFRFASLDLVDVVPGWVWLVVMLVRGSGALVTVGFGVRFGWVFNCVLLVGMLLGLVCLI